MKRWCLFSLLLALAACRVPAPQPPTPPLPLLTVHVTDAATGADLVGARVYRDNVPNEGIIVADSARATWGVVSGGFNACASREGYQEHCVPIFDVPVEVGIALSKQVEPPAPPVVDVDIAPIAWPPTPRAPITRLPPVRAEEGDGFWSYESYDVGLAHDPPDEPSDNYVRGNFGPMDMPGCDLPRVSGDYADFTMSWALPQYPPDKQVCQLKVHQAAGYTHFGTYFAFSRNQDVTVDAFEDALKRVHRAGLRNVVTLFGGDGESWGETVRPLVERWYNAGALTRGDILVVCWQCDGKYDPYPLAKLTVQVSDWAHAHGLKSALHWYGGRVVWYNADDDDRRPSTCYNAADLGLRNFCNRTEYGLAMADKVDFQFQQFDPYAPIADERPEHGGARGELRDSLRGSVQGNTCVVVAEYDAQRREDRNAPEIEGDAKGLALLSVRDSQGRSASCGFFGGARLPNGEYVH